MDREKELNNCTAIKAILMLIIVIYHSMRVYAEGTWGPYAPMQDAPILGYISDWLNSFHVYAFTLISGYIFSFIKYERGGIRDINHSLVIRLNVFLYHMYLLLQHGLRRFMHIILEQKTLLRNISLGCHRVNYGFCSCSSGCF